MSRKEDWTGLAGRVALVTGAASGIGRMASLRFAEVGAHVMCADIDGDGAKAVSEEVIGEGGTAAALQLDVTDESAVEKALTQCIDSLGGFDVLFNNAGVGSAEFGYEATLNVNLNGVYYGLKHGAPLLAKRGGGSIINTASIAGLAGLVSPLPVESELPELPEGSGVAYMASKHAVVGLTRQFAVYYGRRGVRVNAVAPGYIETPMTARMRDDSVVEQGLADLHLLGRLGQPEEVADAAVFLASDRASFITGVILPVDGGYTAR